MADWTTIPNSSLEPGKPIRTIDGLALRDNPIAIAEGAGGAPRIDPIGAMAHQGAVGAVGTYAWLGETTVTTTEPGATRAGSALRYAGVNSDVAQNQILFSIAGTGSTIAPQGTWRAMGRAHHLGGSGGGRYPATLWLRIS